MTAIPPDFHFSQASLQDFTDCQRRFQLRYLQQLAWPALQAEPVLENEQRLSLGGAFHRLAQQYLVGVEAARLGKMAVGQGASSDLPRWWENFLRYALPLAGLPLAGVANAGRLERVLAVEQVLSAPFQGYRLIAKYDAVFRLERPEGARFAIFDWKTSRTRPKRSWLAERLQTRVYPYLLAEAGGFLNHGQPIPPGQIEMIYWFTEYPEQPERFTYDADQHRQDGVILSGLVTEIESLPDEQFELTPHEERCAFCTYRSLCERGVQAGRLKTMPAEPEAVDDFGLSFDFDQIAEVEF